MFDIICNFILFLIYMYIIIKASFYDVFEEEDRKEAMKEKQERLAYEKKFIKYKKMQKKNHNYFYRPHSRRQQNIYHLMIFFGY